jgi:hypothetical protein
MSLSFGVMVAYLSIIDKGLKGLGYIETSSVLSKVVIVVSISGIIGNYAYSYALKRTRRYKLITNLGTPPYT